jgi:adenylate cyclase
MNKEIERKFLVQLDKLPKEFWDNQHVFIAQTYLSLDPVVRVRVCTSTEETKGFLTIKVPIKGISNAVANSEFEYEIPLKDAMELFHDEQGHRKFLVKKRYALKIKDHTWEIDNFLGDLAGLVIAEIELSDPDEEFDHPTWLGEEISSNPKYANANMWKNLK